VTCCATIEGLRIEPLQPSNVPVPHVSEAALQAADRRADLLSKRPADLTRVAPQAAQQALAMRTALVAVDGGYTKF
jgi:hypothetical protein